MVRNWLKSKRGKVWPLVAVLSAGLLVLDACATTEEGEGTEPPTPVNGVREEVGTPSVQATPTPQPVVDYVTPPEVTPRPEEFLPPEKGIAPPEGVSYSSPYAPSFQPYPYFETGCAQQTGIVVSGVGTIAVEADVAILTVGVEVQGRTVEEARNQAAETMTAVIEALTDNGVAEGDIKTQYFSIFPRYEYTQSGFQVLVGYTVIHNVNAKIRDVVNAGSVIDAVAGAGGNLAQIWNISFTVDDPSPYLSQAREVALLDAVAKAEQMAALTGSTLGKPICVTESSAFVPPPIFIERGIAEGASAVPTPLLPGDSEISVSVQIVFAIE